MKFLIFSIFLFLLFPNTTKAQVVINEVSPSEEWVELYNTGSSDVSLDGCVLNMGNSGQDVTFGATDVILVYGYKVAEKGISSEWNTNWLNNGGDSVMLNCLINDSTTYGSEVENKTYGRNPNGSGGFVVLEMATKSAINSGPQPTPTPTPLPSPTPAPTATPQPSPTKTPSPTPTKSPTPAPTKTPTPVAKSTTSATASSVLGLRNELVTPSPTQFVSAGTSQNFPILPTILILAGVLCVGGAGFTLIRRIKNENL